MTKSKRTQRIRKSLYVRVQWYETGKKLGYYRNIAIDAALQPKLDAALDLLIEEDLKAALARARSRGSTGANGRKAQRLQSVSPRTKPAAGAAANSTVTDSQKPSRKRSGNAFRLSPPKRRAD